MDTGKAEGGFIKNYDRKVKIVRKFEDQGKEKSPRMGGFAGEESC